MTFWKNLNGLKQELGHFGYVNHSTGRNVGTEYY